MCYSLNKDKKKQFVKKYAICNEKCYSKKSSGCGINDKDIESPLDREEISEAKVQCTKKMKASCSHQNAKCAKKEKIPISKKPIRKPNKLTAERCTESETDKVDQSPILLSIHQCKSCQKKKSKPVCKEKTKEEDEKQIDEKEIDQSPVLLCVDKCKEIEEKKNKEEKIDTATVDKSPMMLSVDQCREDLKKKVENKKEQELAKVNVDQSPMLLSVGECRKHKKSVKDAKKKKTSRSSKEREGTYIHMYIKIIFKNNVINHF